jgi:predicted enzyme related to lactoylglutathione lyase
MAIDTLNEFLYIFRMEMKIELIPIPVTDVDRAKAFYEKVGFHADQDHKVNENLRFVQLTPPGSACSIVIGVGISPMKPGSVDAYQMVIKDAKQAREELLKRGIDVSEVDEQPWGNFVYFNDPDGNKWSLQELPPRT